MKKPAGMNEWLEKAKQLHRGGHFAEAKSLYKKVLKQAPNHVDTLFMLGTLYMQQGKIEKAEPFLRKVLVNQPNHVEALNNLGLGLCHAGRISEGLALIQQAIHLSPEYVDAWDNFARITRQAGNLEETTLAYLKLLDINTTHFPALDGLARVYKAQGCTTEAEAYFLRALACKPRTPDTVIELSALYADIGQSRKAVSILRSALDIIPEHRDIYNRLGSLLQDLGELQEALLCYQKANTLSPYDAQSLWGMSFVQLLSGEIAEGWDFYENRWGVLTDAQHPPFPTWQGEDITQSSILVYPEQGFGDEILFASCVPDLLQCAQRVEIICQKRLGALYQRSFPSAKIYAVREIDEFGSWKCMTQCDYQIAIGSLPKIFRRHVEDFPIAPAYFYADAQKVAYWRAQLATLGKSPKIGICWRSGLRTGGRSRNYTAIADWAPIFSVPNVMFVNLQYDECSAELAEIKARFGVDVVNFPDIDLRNDQDDVAALIMALDAVLSAGTAVSELAGALGVPVFRYGNRAWTSLGTERMPWHPNMRLFVRNDPEETWAATMAAMAEALQSFLESPTCRRVDRFTPKITEPSSVIARALEDYAKQEWAFAEQRCRQVLGQYPSHGDAAHLLGCVLRSCNRPHEAITALSAAHAAQPEEPTILLNRGLTHLDIGEEDAATTDFYATIAKDATCGDARLNLGELLNKKARPSEALSVLKPALTETAVPDFAAQVCHAIAHAYYQQGMLDEGESAVSESEGCFLRALKRDPHSSDLLLRLSRLYMEAGRWLNAEKTLERLLQLSPDHFEAHSNLADVLQALGDDLPSALSHYQAAHKLRPLDPRPKQSMTFVYLMQGELQKGWASYESRWESASGGRDTRIPIWEGQSLLGKSLLVSPEQGLGDEILFSSCLPDIVEQAARVGIICEKRLGDIYARSFPTATIYPTREAGTSLWECAVHDYDYQVASGSLPRFLRKNLEDFPASPAYLMADPEKVAFWKTRLQAQKGSRTIGICWRSGLRSGMRHRLYTPIAAWKPIFQYDKQAVFVNLQYGECAEELAEIERLFGVRVVHFNDLDLRNDQENLAALMVALDVVVSAGTAVAELAAALGVTVFRYGDKAWTSLGTEHMPWHPSMRLFMRANPEALWDTTMESIAQALQKYFAPSAIIQPKSRTSKSVRPTKVMAKALAAFEAGQFSDAEQCCREIIAQYPRHVESWILLGCTFKERGASQDAIDAFDKACALQPKEATIYLNRGRAWQDLQELQRALEDFQKAAALDKGNLEAQLSLGETFSAQGAYDKALEILEALLEKSAKQPLFAAQVHYAVAYAAHHLCKYDRAEEHLKKAVRLDPAYPGAYNGLGNLLRDLHRLDEALACYQKASELRPEIPEFHSNIGNALRELGCLSEGDAAFREALRLRPDYADAWSNWGNLLNDMRQHAEAIQAHRQSLVLRPDDHATRLNLSYPLLATGQLLEGWAMYESRWPSGTQGQMLQWYPDWQGEDLTGCSILVLPEQGLGDEIMFASCVPEVLAVARQAVVICQERLGGLYTRSFPNAHVVAMPAGLVRLPKTLPVCDYQITLGSLPRLLRTRIEDFPERPAYLFADPERVVYWRSRLAECGNTLKIGICWRSGLRTHGRERYYTPITDWAPIFSLPNITFVNLQYDDCAAELAEVEARFGVKVVNFPDIDLRDDQEGVAALITALDGVISAPTAVAELAGALGAPVLRYDKSWTSLGTDRMPWHPTMQVFPVRPEAPWTEVTSRMAVALQESVMAKGTADVSALQWVETPHGAMLVVGNTQAAQDLRRDGYHAPDMISLLTSLLQPGHWVLEVGAGFGTVTVPVARAVGEAGLVIACEADEPLFQFLCANVALNGCEQVHAECVTLAAETAIPSEANTSLAATWRRGRRPHVTTVDALHLPQCDLIRIDPARVHTLTLLQGAQATILRYKPFIHIAHTTLAAAEQEPCAAFLQQIGYAWPAFTEASENVGWLAYPTAHK